MAGERLFTEEELEDLGKLTITKAKEAADAGDAERCKALIDQMYEELAMLHDASTVWVTGLQSFIYNNYGLEALKEAERYAHGIEGKLVFNLEMGDMTVRENVEQHCSGVKGHVHQDIEVVEEDDWIDVIVRPCGSGGMLMNRGAYEEGCARISEACPETWGLPDFPIYCVHCPMGEQGAVDAGGVMRFVHPTDGMESGKDLGPNCVYRIYKDPKDIPEDYFTRIGKKRP